MSSLDLDNEQLLLKIKTHTASVLANTSTEHKYAPSFDLSSPSKEFAATIDHTLLKPDATIAQVEKLCAEAKEYGFKSCCVNPIHIPLVTSLLNDSPTTVPCSVISFPLGATPTSTKAAEASTAIFDGAREIDMVISIGHLKAQDYRYALADIAAVADVCNAAKVPLKVIIETVFLTDEEKAAACWLACEAGARFVKTSTGFSGGGATVEDIGLMRRAVAYKDGAVLVKASGGVRTFQQCAAMLKAGAHRIGASAGVSIMQGQAQGGSGY